MHYNYNGMIGYVETAAKNGLNISTCMPRLTDFFKYNQLGSYNGDPDGIRQGAKVRVYFRHSSGLKSMFKDLFKGNIERVELVENGPDLKGWRMEVYWFKYFLCLIK